MTSPTKILLVDDDPNILFGTSRILNASGYDVLTAQSGAEAIEQCKAHHPDLVLMDVIMPGMDGLSACREIKTHPELNDIFILLLSGKKILPEDQAQGLAAGADGYMSRPFVQKEFLERLKSLIRIQQSQKVLKKSEQWFNTTLNSIGDGVIATDANEAVIFMNPVAEKLTGWDLPDAAGRPCSQIFRIRNDESGEPMENPISRAITEGIIVGIANHTILFRKDGSTCYIADSAAPIKDEKRAITGAVLVFQDVTEKREQELAIRRAHKEWEDIFEAISHPTLVLDAQHGIIKANQATLDLAQKPLEELVGKKCHQLFHASSSPAPGCPLKTMIQSGSAERQDMEMEAFDRVYLVSCTPVFNEDNSFKHAIHISTDITERKRAEQKVQQDLQERDLMLKEIHHRVKNNLQIVISLINLQLEKIEPSTTKEIFSEIKNRIYSMAIVHEKLYESQSLSDIQLKPIVTSIVKSLSYAYDQLNKVQTDLDIAEISLGIEKAIPCSLIINEWMSNALKHAFCSTENGHIHISMHQDRDSTIKLIFNDTGKGLPAEIDPLAPQTMGLTIVSVLVEQLDGKLSVDRQDGTSFTLVFR